MDRFAGRVAVITGGASGLGRATARRLTSEGAEIIIVDKDSERGGETVESLAEVGGKAHFLQADLSRYSAIELTADVIAGTTDAVHVLVNNAGIGQFSSVEDFAPEHWDPILSINMKSVLEMTVRLLPLLREGHASIVNVSSDGGVKGRAGCPVYDLTKAAVNSLSKSMAVGYAKYGIRANAVAPGWAVTEFHFGGAKDPHAKKLELEQFETDSCVMRRLARPEEIAAAIAFLASNDASYVTGQVLSVDGGRAGLDTR